MDKSEKNSDFAAVAVPAKDGDFVRHADDVKLAELGYKAEFRREFSVKFSLFWMSRMNLNNLSAHRNHLFCVFHYGCDRFRYFYVLLSFDVG
jgi:hypothetical protein